MRRVGLNIYLLNEIEGRFQYSVLHTSTHQWGQSRLDFCSLSNHLHLGYFDLWIFMYTCTKRCIDMDLLRSQFGVFTCMGRFYYLEQIFKLFYFLFFAFPCGIGLVGYSSIFNFMLP